MNQGARPGGYRSHKKGKGKVTVERRDVVDPVMADMSSGVGRVNHSRYWAPRFCEEKDQYSSVRVYGPDGTLTRVIPRTDLTRPFPQKPGIGWNTKLFL